MATLHVHWVGEQALLPRAELERLIELARRSEEVQVEGLADDIPSTGIAALAQQGGAFNFLGQDDDLYSVNDLKVRYR